MQRNRVWHWFDARDCTDFKIQNEMFPFRRQKCRTFCMNWVLLFFRCRNFFYCQPERAPEKGYILSYYAIIFFDAGVRKVGGLVFHNIFFPNFPNFVLTSFAQSCCRGFSVSQERGAMWRRLMLHMQSIWHCKYAELAYEHFFQSHKKMEWEGV